MAGGGIPCIEYLIQVQIFFYLEFYWKPMKQTEIGAYKCYAIDNCSAQTCFPQKLKYFNRKEGNRCTSQDTSYNTQL